MLVANGLVGGKVLHCFTAAYAQRRAYSKVRALKTRPTTMSAAILERHSPQAYPNLEAVAAELQGSAFVYEDEFEFGLGLLLDALEGQASRA